MPLIVFNLEGIFLQLALESHSIRKFSEKNCKRQELGGLKCIHFVFVM